MDRFKSLPANLRIKINEYAVSTGFSEPMDRLNSLPTKLRFKIYEYTISTDVSEPKHAWEPQKAVDLCYASLMGVNKATQDDIVRLYTKGRKAGLMLYFDNLPALYIACEASKTASILQDAKIRFCRVVPSHRDAERLIAAGYVSHVKLDIEDFFCAIDGFEHSWLYNPALCKTPYASEFSLKLNAFRFYRDSNDHTCCNEVDHIAKVEFPPLYRSLKLTNYTYGLKSDWQDSGAFVLEGKLKDVTRALGSLFFILKR